MSKELKDQKNTRAESGRPDNGSGFTAPNRDASRVVDALRRGGFACLFPEIIEPTWGAIAERLAGFPVRVHFAALPDEPRGDPARAFVVSTYWADPETYREDDGERTLRYASQWESDFSVEVADCKDRRSWKGTKICGAKAILWATGENLCRALIQLACRGVHEGELVLPIPENMDLRKMGVLGAYTFTPSPPIRKASINSHASQHLPN